MNRKLFCLLLFSALIALSAAAQEETADPFDQDRPAISPATSGARLSSRATVGSTKSEPGDQLRIAVAEHTRSMLSQSLLREPEQVQKNIKDRIPLHREGRPEEVALALAAQVENDFITDAELPVDGGMAMRMV